MSEKRFVRGVNESAWDMLRKYAFDFDRYMGPVLSELILRFLPVMRREQKEKIKKGEK
jgi:hypothetical protein